MLKAKAREILGIDGLSLTEFDFSDKYLKKKYRGCSHQFWEDLQHFHDTLLYWNKKGLSSAGEIQKKNLLEKYI